MKVETVMALARKNLGTGAMDSSARLCLSDAVELYNAGDFRNAKARALRSIQYSVGIFHADFQSAAGECAKGWTCPRSPASTPACPAPLPSAERSESGPSTSALRSRRFCRPENLPMPTRRHRAIELLNRLERGPSFDVIGQVLTPEVAASKYRLWSRTWVLEELKKLIPELRALTTEAHGEICKTDPCDLCQYGYRSARP